MPRPPIYFLLRKSLSSILAYIPWLTKERFGKNRALYDQIKYLHLSMHLGARLFAYNDRVSYTGILSYLEARVPTHYFALNIALSYGDSVLDLIKSLFRKYREELTGCSLSLILESLSQFTKVQKKTYEYICEEYNQPLNKPLDTKSFKAIFKKAHTQESFLRYILELGQGVSLEDFEDILSGFHEIPRVNLLVLLHASGYERALGNPFFFIKMLRLTRNDRVPLEPLRYLLRTFKYDQWELERILEEALMLLGDNAQIIVDLYKESLPKFHIKDSLGFFLRVLDREINEKNEYNQANTLITSGFLEGDLSPVLTHLDFYNRTSIYCKGFKTTIGLLKRRGVNLEEARRQGSPRFLALLDG